MRRPRSAQTAPGNSSARLASELVSINRGDSKIAPTAVFRSEDLEQDDIDALFNR